MDAADVESVELFAGLSRDQLDELIAAGTEISIEPDIELFAEGAPADFWWVLVEGSVNLFRRVGREDVLVGRMDVPGRWAGGFRAWDDEGSYLATGRGLTAGRMLRVPSDALRRLSSRWFPFGSHLISGLYHTARSIESTARQRESLVTLGMLAAGLAHELNNPAAAAVRAVDSLERTCTALLKSLRNLADQDISASQFATVDTLRLQLRRPPATADALDVADMQESVASWLHRHGVTKSWQIATALVAAGADVEWCERAGAVLPSTALEPGLEWVASSSSAAELITQVKESTGRVSDLVAAVRSYSQVDRASAQQIDVTEGIESTLVMLGHALGASVRVERDFDQATPRIEAYPGELNQVWTNLITNAIDAMHGEGTLSLVTRAESAAAVIKVGDTGEGMTPQIAAHAFDAFFTTKDVGKGTGLGLDIARRIVNERHGGTITIESQPGRTVVTVRLPLRAPQ